MPSSKNQSSMRSKNLLSSSGLSVSKLGAFFSPGLGILRLGIVVTRCCTGTALELANVPADGPVISIIFGKGVFGKFVCEDKGVCVMYSEAPASCSRLAVTRDWCLCTTGSCDRVLKFDCKPGDCPALLELFVERGGILNNE